MLSQRRVKTKPLAEFLRRMGMSLEAGIDIRKALESEARRSPPPLKRHVDVIQVAVAGGSSLTDAINRCGEFFPPLVKELVAVGEQTGHLPEVLKQLSQHYEQQLVLRRTFFSAIAWPMTQLGIALFVVGFVIWIMGVIQSMTGQSIDVLGLGLTGNRGLALYLIFLSTVAAIVWFVYRAVVSGKLWVAPIQRFVMQLPVVGGALRTLAIARFAWTLQLATATALDVKRSLRLALGSTHNVEFTSPRQRVEDSIQRGNEIHEALSQTGVFPIEFVHSVQVGEESGRLSETLAIVARQYQEEARRALAILARLAGYAVWALVAVFIIVLIFRLFGFYVGAINQAVQGTR